MYTFKKFKITYPPSKLPKVTNLSILLSVILELILSFLKSIKLCSLFKKNIGLIFDRFSKVKWVFYKFQMSLLKKKKLLLICSEDEALK